MFPVEPRHDELDERGLFVVQDSELRSKILPLFSLDPRATKERPIGQGTTFRIDPWFQCATAFHVVEQLFEIDPSHTGLVLKSGIRLVALELNSTTYGQ